MSAENLRRIAAAFSEKVMQLETVPDPLGMLAEVTTAIARNNAETVFFKAQTEPGWTPEEAQALADNFIKDHVITIADVIHANGGTLEMAEDLAKVAATAYGTRLEELTRSYGHGGVA